MNAPRPVPSEPSPRATAGAPAAFESLVAPYAQRLYRFLVVRLGDEREARDALQETLLAAWQGLPRLRDRDRPWAWLAGIAANKAADSARRHVPVVPLHDVEPGYVHGGPSDVAAALAKLPRSAREVLLLRYLLRLSEDETAAVLGVRVGTVKSRASRARRLLLEELG
jgi:DNA-directed RNA polymerase specialized sigma24 family protein